MRPTSFHAFVCAVALVALASGLPAGRAEAQCITGPSGLCDGQPIQLCGPAGAVWYGWSGPGVESDQQCITVNQPGRYTLFWVDQNGGDQVCFQDVIQSGSPLASITGPTQVCNGSTATWSGPTGSFNWAWTGPGGFSATTQTIHIGVAGTYQLVVSNSAGCVSAPVTRDLAVLPRPTASISGPASVCSGSSATLSGPAGNLSWEWSGPAGFSATTQSVSVSAAGSYQLVVTDNVTGCSHSGSHTLSVTTRPVATIAAPPSLCGSAELCGPDGNFTYAWSGPGGMSSSSQCVVATAAGSYELVVTDVSSGCSSTPATQVLATGSTPLVTIRGSSETCPGRVAELCGPDGNFGFAWSGPSGFAATSACIDATEAGAYTLVVTDLGSGCSAAPVTKVITECSSIENCPRPVSFWRSACLGNEHPVDVPMVARAVDDRAAFFRWGVAKTQAFTALMKGGRGTLAHLAARQYAAMWANVVASECNVTARGRAVALRTNTQINLLGVSTTVGEWLAATDAQLSALSFKSERDQSTRMAYRKIMLVGIHVNHGFGIGNVCSRRPQGDDSQAASGTVSEDESMAAELEQDLGASEMDLSVEPNPFSSRAWIRFSVPSSASSDVQVGVFDLAGRQVRTLARGSFGPGVHEVEWDGRDDSGGLARNGVYFVLTRVDGRKLESRLTLLR